MQQDLEHCSAVEAVFSIVDLPENSEPMFLLFYVLCG